MAADPGITYNCGKTEQMPVPAKNIRRKVLILIALLLLAGLLGLRALRAWRVQKSWAQFERIDCARSFRDVQYVTGGTDPFQTLDIYIPKAPCAALAPLIIWIHGGAWVSGDKNHPPAQLMLDRGYAVASLNYRLSNRCSFPAQIHDIKAAVRYLRAHAGEYKLDAGRFGAWGQSAGGHLVALLGTSGGAGQLEGSLGNNDCSSSIQAAADWCGPTDLVTISAQASKDSKIDFKSPTNPVAVLMGSKQSPEDLLAASPVKYVSKSSPPFFILHAENDDVVPAAQAKELGALLRHASVPVICHISPDGGHGLFRREFFAETMNFFDRYLKNK